MDKDAISAKRPQAFIEHEQTEIRRNSSVISANPEAMKQRREAIERVNKEKMDDEKGIREVENV